MRFIKMSVNLYRILLRSPVRSLCSDPRHSCYVSFSRTSSQAKFILMLSGYWQHACCYGYLRCLGWFSCFEMCDTICVTGIYLSLQYAALKGGYNAISCILSFYTIKSWIAMHAHAFSDLCESKSVSFMDRKSSAA